MKDLIKQFYKLSKAEILTLEFLRGHTLNTFNSQELANLIKLDLTTIQRGLKTLTECNLIIRTQINLSGGGYEYLYKALPLAEFKEKLFSKNELKFKENKKIIGEL